MSFLSSEKWEVLLNTLFLNLRKSTLFSGQAKLIVIPVLVIMALVLFPVTIGVLFAYAAYRYIPQREMRNAIIAVIIVFTILVGIMWISALFSDTSDDNTIPQQSDISVLPREQEVPIAVESVVVEQAAQPTEGALVTRVVDGDTIQLETGEVLRYIGIDTPETVHPDKSVQCFGKEASAKNKALVEGKRVRLEKDVSETDKYDRLLRYVYIGDVFVNDYLVRQGFAYSSSYPPDVKYQDQFRQAEQEARSDSRGLWESCPPATQQASPTAIPKLAPIPQSSSDVPSSSSSYTGADKDCGDFATHNEAQEFFIAQGGPTNDSHKLDSDGDGIACETLP